MIPSSSSRTVGGSPLQVTSSPPKMYCFCYLFCGFFSLQPTNIQPYSKTEHKAELLDRHRPHNKVFFLYSLRHIKKTDNHSVWFSFKKVMLWGKKHVYFSEGLPTLLAKKATFADLIVILFFIICKYYNLEIYEKVIIAVIVFICLCRDLIVSNFKSSYKGTSKYMYTN